MKKNNQGASKIVTVLTLIVFVACAGLAIYFTKTKDDKSIRDTDSYKTIDMTGCSIKIPESFVNSSDHYYVSNGTKNLCFYECDKASVSVDVQQQNGVTITQDMIDKNLENYKINGESVNPVNMGDYTLTSYETTDKVMDGDVETVHILCAYFAKDDCIYAVSACCSAEDFSEYEEYMLKWIDSFKFI